MTLTKIQQDSEILVIGSVYTILSAAILPVYMLIFHALRAREEFQKNISYKLLKLLYYCDASQAICHAMSGLFLIFPNVENHLEVFVRVIGCTVNSLWLATFPILAVLACTRIGIVYFKLKPIEWTLWMRSSLATSSVYIFGVWSIGCITQNLQLDGVSWSYDMSVPLAPTLAQLELILCFPILVLNFCSYLMIVFSIYLSKRKVVSSQSARAEVEILVQGFSLSAYMAILIVLWHNAESWFEMTNLAQCFLNCAWILFLYLNSGLLIATNRGVRGQIRDTLRKTIRPREATSSTVFVVPTGVY